MPKAPESQDIAREVKWLLKDTRRQRPQVIPSFEEMGLTVGTRIRLINNYKHEDEVNARVGIIEAIYPRYVLVKTDRYRITVLAHDISIGKFGIEILDGKEQDMPRRDGPTQLETARAAYTKEDYEGLRSQGLSNRAIANKWQIHEGTLIQLRKDWGLPVQSFFDPVTPNPVPEPIGVPGDLTDTANITLAAPIDRPVSMESYRMEDNSALADDEPHEPIPTECVKRESYVQPNWEAWRDESEPPGATCPLPGVLIEKIVKAQMAEYRNEFHSALRMLRKYMNGVIDDEILNLSQQFDNIRGDLHHLTSEFREHELDKESHLTDETVGRIDEMDKRIATNLTTGWGADTKKWIQGLSDRVSLIVMENCAEHDEFRKVVRQVPTMVYINELYARINKIFAEHRHQVGPGHWSGKADD